MEGERCESCTFHPQRGVWYIAEPHQQPGLGPGGCLGELVEPEELSFLHIPHLHHAQQEVSLEGFPGLSCPQQTLQPHLDGLAIAVVVVMVGDGSQRVDVKKLEEGVEGNRRNDSVAQRTHPSRGRSLPLHQQIGAPQSGPAELTRLPHPVHAC